MTMATTLSAYNLARVSDDARDDVKRTVRAIWFAMTPVGHMVDVFGSWVVRRLYLPLERDVLFFKGVKTALDELPLTTVVDPDAVVLAKLEMLYARLRHVHQRALKVARHRDLARTSASFEKMANVTAALRDAVAEAKTALVEHDAEARLHTDEIKAVNETFEGLFRSISKGSVEASADVRELAAAAAARRHAKPDEGWAGRIATAVKDAND
jgi:hypothetical protein